MLHSVQVIEKTVLPRATKARPFFGSGIAVPILGRLRPVGMVGACDILVGQTPWSAVGPLADPGITDGLYVPTPASVRRLGRLSHIFVAHPDGSYRLSPALRGRPNEDMGNAWLRGRSVSQTLDCL
jgi:hypothetical protein